MTIQGVYDKYKHLDELLSDRKLLKGMNNHILFDLWQAIKEEIEGKEFIDIETTKMTRAFFPNTNKVRGAHLWIDDKKSFLSKDQIIALQLWLKELWEEIRKQEKIEESLNK